MTRSVAELRARYERGELPRDEYWLAAQAVYRETRERTPVPPDGPVTRIDREGDDLIVEIRGGLRMLWDPDDLRTAPNMLLNHGAYEELEREVLLALAARSRVVFDVGANVGWYTLHLARLIAPGGGRVVAFEPIPRTFEVLQRNIALNGLQSATTLCRYGLGDRAEETEFFLPAVTGSVAASRFPLFESQHNTRVRARIARLDDVVRELGVDCLDLIKADVEGGELPLLLGGLRTIREFRPAIFLELLRKWSRVHGYHPNAVLDLLAAEGYRCHAITEGGLVELTAISDECSSTNFLFLQA